MNAGNLASSVGGTCVLNLGSCTLTASQHSVAAVAASGAAACVTPVLCTRPRSDTIKAAEWVYGRGGEGG